jgi:hypothetical protein
LSPEHVERCHEIDATLVSSYCQINSCFYRGFYRSIYYINIDLTQRCFFFGDLVGTSVYNVTHPSKHRLVGPTVGPLMIKVGIQLAEAPNPSRRFADYKIKVGL